MQLIIVLLEILCVLDSVSTRCIIGCPCINDSPCEYYCENSTCQNAIPTYGKCKGYVIHPRECGNLKYCDPLLLTCQYRKSDGYICVADYACYSGYCDPKTKTCQEKNDGFNYFYIWVPSVAVGGVSILIILLVSCRMYALRRRALAAYQIQTPRILSPNVRVVAYENPAIVSEAPPPSYSEAILHSGVSVPNKDP